MTDWTWPLGAPADERSSLRIFSVTPNWKDGVVERLEWLTSVNPSETDNEQRRSLRLYPRRYFDATFMRVGAQRQRLDSFIVGTGPSKFLVPLWHEQFKLPDGRADGFIPMSDITMREFNLGDLLMISNGDPDDFGMLKVIGESDQGIAVTSYTNLGTWPPGSRVTPLRVAVNVDTVTLTAPRQDVVEVPLRFTLTEADTTVAPRWGDVDNLWTFRPDRSEQLSLNYMRNVFTTDFNVGTFDVFDASKVEQVSTSLSVKLFGRKNIYAFRQFLYAARGRAVRFWAPTFMQDITPIEDLSGLTIVAKATGFDDVMVTPQEVRKYIAIQTEGGMFYRELSNVTTIREGRKQVSTLYTVTEELPELTVSEVKSISFMVESRFDNDGFDLLHRTDDAAHMSTSVLLRSAKQSDDLPDLPLDSDLTAPTVLQRRFTPKYFRVDGPRQMSFALTTNNDEIRVDFVARRKGDLCGLRWESKDTKDHALLAYIEDRDYRNCSLGFNIELSPSMPVLNDPQKALSLAVTGRDAAGNPAVYYIPLFRYCDNPTGRSAYVSIDFSTVMSGFDLDVPVYAGDVDVMILAIVCDQYIEGSFDPLPTQVEGWMTMTNITVGGARSHIRRYDLRIAPHNIGMSTSYDDHYDQSPQRIVENCNALGYTGPYNHYCGMSTFPERPWSTSESRYVQRAAGALNVVNNPTKAWHRSLAQLCKAQGSSLIQAVSYEVFSEWARLDWVQRAWDDSYGYTGYTPPSYLLSPCIPDAMAWLHQALIEFADIAAEVGVPIRMQVGEPWWWYQPQTMKPCVYDYPTKVKFNAQTGLFAPEFPTILSTASGTPYDEFKTFLRDELGQSVLDCRTAIKAKYPDALVSALVFYPTIVPPEYGIMSYINNPVAKYHYPNLDFFQSEAYDWITVGNLEDAKQAMTIPLVDLGYPRDLVEYLGGFAPEEPAGARRLQWRRIIANMRDNLSYGIARQYVWAYTIVMRDSVTIPDSSLQYFYWGNRKTPGTV